MTKILLLRHGEVEGINPPRFRGREDLQLTPRGIAQAEAVAKRIGSAWQPSVVYASPLQRCVATAAPVARACGVETRVLDSLADIDYGAWQFRSHEDVQREFPSLYAAWLAAPHLVRFPRGESLQDLAARASDALRFVLERHADETVVMVGHDNLNRALLLQLLDQPLSAYWRIEQMPCCINEVQVSGTEIRVIRVNDTAHLETPRS